MRLLPRTIIIIETIHSHQHRDITISNPCCCSWQDYAQNISSVPEARGFSVWRTLHANEWPTWNSILHQYNISRMLM